MASLQVTRMADYVELLLNGLELERPRMYAYEPHEPVAAFLKQVAIDTGSKSADITSSQGAAISHSMAHAFAWRPGRTLMLDEKNVKIEAEAAGGPVGGQSLPGAMHRASLVKAQMKYVVITGGVVSGLGKGVTASSLGVMMRCAGFRVTSIKIDPYLNVDAGTMSPFEHGEVFTLDDGGEVDLDLGNYERFNDITLSRDNNITTGKIYQQCLERERRGDYLGKTVQVVPHVTDAIMDWIQRVAHVPADGLSGPPDICIIELGGTVGDIESMPYVEALRQFQFRVGRDNIAFFHVSLVPVLGAVGEEKTKPTQHSVQQLRSVGLSPDFLVCRSTKPLSSSTKEKLANFTHVPAENCLGVHDVSNIYRVPLLLQHQGATQNLLARLALVARPNHKLLSDWTSLAELVDSLKTKVTIAVVGKYTNLSDAYLSVSKALNHASYHVERKIDIQWVDASDLHEDVAQSNAAKYAEAWDIVKNADGVLVPGGFGDRGVEGKICAAKWCRENKKPYLGVCLGFQVAVIEFARSILGLAGAHSSEFDENSPHPVVIFMPEVSRTHMGGTMRLGSRRTMLKGTDCLTCRLYGGATAFDERHRHRYEVNMAYVKQFEENGMNFVGRDTSGERMEVLELPTSIHPFFVGAQYHPEFKSRPNKPSPLFVGLLQAACGLPIQAAE